MKGSLRKIALESAALLLVRSTSDSGKTLSGFWDLVVCFHLTRYFCISNLQVDQVDKYSMCGTMYASFNLFEVFIRDYDV